MDPLSLVEEILAQDGGERELKRAFKETKVKDKVFIPSPGPQTDAYFSQADILLYGGQAGGGKLLSINTLVPVPLSTDPSGYKKHGDLKAGDEVFSPNGQAVKVLQRHPDCHDPDVHEVEFDTGEIILADAKHLWQTWDCKERDRLLRASSEWREKRKDKRASRAKSDSKKPWVSRSITQINQEREYDILQPAPSIRTTAQIRDTLKIGRNKRLNHSVDVIAPISGEHQDLPVDPYLFGLWLGDGFTHGDQIIMLEDDWAKIITPDPRKTVREHIARNRKQAVLIKSFYELSFCKKIGQKHIPAEYKRASYEQRLELLRGMMDTDGTIDKRGHCELGFSNYQLAVDACEVINSLGIKTKINIKKFEKEEWNTHYRMKFLCDEIVFKLPRKAERQKPVKRQTVYRRYIKDVRKTDAKCIMNCITVEGGLYCVGETFITTHNSGLIIGLALNEHKRSLIVRRQGVDVHGLVDNAKGILGTSSGFTGGPGGSRPTYTSKDGRIIHFEGYGDIDDIGAKQGTPHDLIAIDEAAQLSEHAIRLLMGWNRTTEPNQRCRVVMASNPPLDTTGDWMISFFAPWLDDRHHNPAMPGELRWFVVDDSGRDIEVDGPDDYIEIDGSKYYPLSRTFIPASVEDNPYIDASYKNTLNSLPEPYRSALRDGNFLKARQDDQWQVIPTAWIRAAQDRWREKGRPNDVPQCAIGVDVAQGGQDNTILSIRYDGFFDELIKVPGIETPDGPSVAGLIMQNKRGNPDIVIDMGGGYGGSAFDHLKANGINPTAYKGAEKSMARTSDRKLKFTNKRSESYWKLREALDPSQDGGSPIMLPDDPELVSDLTSPKFEVTANGIKVEAKKDLVKRIGRSPDKGDAVVMCWSAGLKMENVMGGWKSRAARAVPRVVTGHQAKRKTAGRRR